MNLDYSKKIGKGLAQRYDWIHDLSLDPLGTLRFSLNWSLLQHALIKKKKKKKI